MIEGLHYDVSSEKIAEILGKRIAQCDEKTSLFAKQAEAQEELSAKMAEMAGADSPKFSGDQSTNLRAKAKEYQERKKMYVFLQEHLIKETYRLSTEDLKFLGIIDRNYY